MFKHFLLGAILMFSGIATLVAQKHDFLLASQHDIALDNYMQAFASPPSDLLAPEIQQGFTGQYGSDEEFYEKASGEIFRFVALDQSGDRAITLDVEYSPDGIATISRSETWAKPNNKRKLCFLAGADHWKFTPVNKDSEAFLEIVPNQSHDYHYVYFDNKKVVRVDGEQNGKVSTKIYCPCNCNNKYKAKRLGVVSTPKDMFGFLACEKDNVCPDKCDPQVILSNREATSNSVLIIKAREVRFK